MEEALREAEKAFDRGEVPVGAVVVSPDGLIIGRGHNLKETLKDPSAHAEVLAIREAASKLGDWRLEGCSIFVTLEPCLMCCGLLVQARVEYLCYGAKDPKFGAVESLFRSLEHPRLNHRVLYKGGVMEDKSVELMRRFFRRLRESG